MVGIDIFSTSKRETVSDRQNSQLKRLSWCQNVIQWAMPQLIWYEIDQSRSCCGNVNVCSKVSTHSVPHSLVDYFTVYSHFPHPEKILQWITERRQLHGSSSIIETDQNIQCQGDLSKWMISCFVSTTVPPPPQFGIQHHWSLQIILWFLLLQWNLKVTCERHPATSR